MQAGANLKAVIAGVRGSATTDRDFETIRSVWLSGGASLFPLSQVSHSFPLIAACASRDGRERPAFWFPEYFCNESAGLLRNGQTDIVVYPVTRDLDPDWPACEALAAASPPDAFVLVHYFGRAGEAARARAFCDRHGARLVEDATHVLRPVDGIGEAGDFACFSPRKFFDIPDGGVLVVRDPADVSRVRAALDAAPPGHPNPTRWRLKRLERALRRRLLPSKRKPRPLAPIRPRLDGPPARLFDQANISPFSLSRLSRAVRSGGLARISGERLEFERRLGGIVADLGVRLVERQLDAVPCWFGLVCEDDRSYLAALDGLRAQGIHALTWPNQLPPEALQSSRRDAVLALRNRYLIVAPPRSGD
ncbi:MAG: DegT/DnrJ/EryC1/StrS family aminotransferase [Mesorhizobium sp.]